MTTETHTVAMTDPQLNNNNNNNNNDGEPKYLHKKFKKMAATTEASVPMESNKREVVASESRVLPGNLKEKHEAFEADSRAKEPAVKTEASPEPEGGESTEGRKSGYVCPYCKLSCAKPSVLQKHIRAHTNERPYPCVPCGFAFKTRSNLYKHCRSRAHALKMEGGDSSKVSEDSDISLSDSASNGTGTPPPASSSTTSSASVVSLKTVKTGKIYKPKFHTALNSVHQDVEVSSVCSNSSTNSSSNSKPNAEQVKEHIDKIIIANQAIVEAVDPRLHKLMQRQQSLVEPKYSEQPLNLSSAEESSHRKRCYSESFAHDNGKDNPQQQNEGSMVKDLLLLKSKSELTNGENFQCPSCKISYTSADNLDAHRRYYCNGSPSHRRPEFQLELEKREPEFELKSDYYNTLQPLPSPGPLLGNTRLVDAYVPPSKQRSESAPTTLRSLEELSKYPRPNSLQMFGGEVRILDNTGETKTMRIEPRQTNSPGEHNVNNKCATSETSSIVVRSGLHSGGTMVHKPPGTPASTPSGSISLPNTPKMLAPIIPNISTPNVAPTISCYSYLEPNLNPLTNITAYNPLTLPQAGIAGILHAGKVIPYVPGMPGPHTLSSVPTVDISVSVPAPESGYKVIPGIPGLHVVPQPLDLASPVKIQTPNIPGIPGPHSNHQMTLSQPLDLVSPAKEDLKLCFKAPSSDNLRAGLISPKLKVVETINNDKYRSRVQTSTPTDHDRHIKNSVSSKYKGVESPRERRKFPYEKSPKSDRTFNYPNGADNNVITSYGKLRYSPKHFSESRKRPSGWPTSELDLNRSSIEPQVMKYETVPHENGRTKGLTVNLPEVKRSTENYGVINGTKLKPEPIAPIITVNLDSSNPTEVPNKISPGAADSVDKNERLDVANNLPKDSSGEDNPHEENNPKFLRPTSLPLKPGTFTPKRHHGITPTANTLPLISPETPRPRKSYGQLYLNGHAYTYLGLKCSTRVFYCTLNRPQPMYVTQQHGLSMYSNWKICKEAPPDLDMAHYDSRHRPASYTTACKKQEDILTHSSQRPTTPVSTDKNSDNDTQEKTKRVKIFDGGFESYEDYIYVRGRGRGRYVCEECGIRCKKPSMLKKHIRTHTDVRPYTCKHCTFSFKTKGNLTKHMKSKAHYKKCVELGVVPVPTLVCDENIDKDAVARLAAGGGNAEESSEEEEETDGEESEESGSEEREEHEAAQGLLSLSRPSANRLPGLLPSGRPTTYPYTLTLSPSTMCTSVTTTTTNSAPLSSQAAAVIQSELSHRYYFPSNRSVQEKTGPRTSVIIQSSKKSESEIETDENSVQVSDTQSNSSQPIDLTTKQTIGSMNSTISQRPKPADILTPVSEPVLMQTIVQTMERLPVQGREWQSEAQGHMLQAYLTERHVMDSKMKLQYRVGASKLDKNATEKEIQYLKQQDTIRSRNLELNGVPTVTYTDPSKMQHTILESRIKNMSKQSPEDLNIDIRDKIYQSNERRPFDIDSIYKEKENASRIISDTENFEQRGGRGSPASRTGFERSHFVLDLPGRSTPSVERQSPRHFNMEMISRNSSAHSQQIKSEIDRSSMFNAMKMMSEIERPRESQTPNQDTRPPSRETRVQSQSPRSQQDSRIPVSSQEFRPHNHHEIRIPSQEFKPVNQEPRNQREDINKSPNNTEPRLNTGPEARPPSRETPRSNFESKSSPVIEISRPNSQETLKTQNIVSERSEVKQNIDVVKQNMAESMKHSVARKMVVGGPGFRSPSPPGGSGKPQAEFLQPSSGPVPNYVSVSEDGRSVCGICNKVFSKPSQLKLHINIHYFERPFRCESCAVSFRTKGHLTKHERSVSHHNKVSMTSTFGAATTSNPRPFKCTDCKIAFRIHGHLAKHLRSKMHIMKLECLCKLPFGTYAEMERSGVNLNDIDTSDCDNSLTSLQNLAQKLYEKDPSKMSQWDAEMIPNQGASGGETSSDEGEPIPLHPMHQYQSHHQLSISENEGSRGYHMPILVSADESKQLNEIRHANPQFNHHHNNNHHNHHHHHHRQQQGSEFGLIERQENPHQSDSRNQIIEIEETSRIITADNESSEKVYKCNICSASIRTLNELQVHSFVEHNIEAETFNVNDKKLNCISGATTSSNNSDSSNGIITTNSNNNELIRLQVNHESDNNRNKKRMNDDNNIINKDDYKRQKLIDDT